MDFNVSFFVIRVVIGLVFSGVLISIIRPKTRLSFISWAVLMSLPAIFAIGVEDRNSMARTAAGFVQLVVLSLVGIARGNVSSTNLEQQATEPDAEPVGQSEE